MIKITFLINKLFILSILLMICFGQSFAQVESTLTGGPWTSPSTWAGNNVPGPHDNVLIKGSVQVDVITFAGSLTITNLGKIEMMIDDQTHLSTFTVDNAVTNSGQIQGNNLNFKIGGNVVNLQIWESNVITLTGTNSHYLSTQSGGTNTFSPVVLRADSSKIISSTDIYLDNVKLQAQSFELTPPFSLYLNKQSILAVVNFIGNNQSIFFSDNSSIKDNPVITSSIQKVFSNLNNRAINSVTTKYSNIVLKGTVKLGGSLITFGGTTVLEDSLFEMIGVPWTTQSNQIFIEGTFINNGYFNMYTTFVSNGTIENNGIWDGSSIDFAAQTTNYISSGPNSKYLVSFTNSSSTFIRSDIYTNSDIYTWGGIGGGNLKFVLQNKNSLYFMGTDNYMNFTNFIGGNNTIYLNGTLTIDSDTLTNVKIKDLNNSQSNNLRVGVKNVFNGTTVIEDSVLKDFGMNWDQTVDINGTLINNGYIELSQVNLFGDLENNGIWDSSPTVIVVKGTTNQKITFNNSSQIKTAIRLESDVSGTTYQWLKDGNNLSGATSKSLYLGVIDTTFYGIYKCSVDNGASFSRTITISNSTVTSVDDNSLTIPNKFSLSQNYPNPFNPSTVISYTIPSVGTGHAPSVLLKVYDVLGREVATLVNEKQPAGNYKVNFDASSLASGIYFYRIIAGQFVQSKKMILLK